MKFLLFWQKARYKSTMSGILEQHYIKQKNLKLLVKQDSSLKGKLPLFSV